MRSAWLSSQMAPEWRSRYSLAGTHVELLTRGQSIGRLVTSLDHSPMAYEADGAGSEPLDYAVVSSWAQLSPHAGQSRRAIDDTASECVT